MKTQLISSFLLALFLIIFNHLTTAQPFDYPTASLSTTWTNNVTAPHSVSFTDGSTVRAILLKGTFGPRFACGFYCNGPCTSYLFGVFIVQTNSGGGIVQPAIGFPQLVWSANRNHPVKLGAKLELTEFGDLVLRDSDGSFVWSTKTAGKSVIGMNMTENGNLVLFNSRDKIVWQSLDYQTDSLVPGQKLVQGQKLIASVSSTNFGKGLYSVEVTNKGLFAYIESNPRRVYYSYLVDGKEGSKEKSYVKFLNGSLSFFVHSSEPRRPDAVIPLPLASSAQYMKLMPDGHLKVLEWQSGWNVVADLFGVRS